MNWHLIRTDQTWPPAGYEFHDRIVGKRYSDTHSTFDERVKEIIRDRKANARLWTDEKLVDPHWVAIELSEYTCRRLNNHPYYCTDGVTPGTQQPALQVQMQAVKDNVCPACGSKRTKPTTCPTCSSVRITGYECLDCDRKVVF